MYKLIELKHDHLFVISQKHVIHLNQLKKIKTNNFYFYDTLLMLHAYFLTLFSLWTFFSSSIREGVLLVLSVVSSHLYLVYLKRFWTLHTYICASLNSTVSLYKIFGINECIAIILNNYVLLQFFKIQILWRLVGLFSLRKTKDL